MSSGRLFRSECFSAFRMCSFSVRQRLHRLETLSNNNPCPSSPSSTILRSAYMALNTLQQDTKYIYIYIYLLSIVHTHTSCFYIKN